MELSSGGKGTALEAEAGHPRLCSSAGLGFPGNLGLTHLHVAEPQGPGHRTS